ncbi:MAG: hypothetical protein GX122_01615 [Candidatus Cloacimonetes bacterium]|nr:hypothetical protein [Candidatus Cloacimonadota bacterium]NLO11105.1 hypothetical protein [Candidatus Cloacimonadota bacterium]
MLRIAIYISDHGFGHAARMAALSDELIKLGVQVLLRTQRRKFLFSCLQSPFCELHPAQMDFGVLHKEDLKSDIPATREALLELFGKRNEIVEREVNWLRNHAIDLVIADIPFLVMEACSYAKKPIFAISNFDWVYIYQHLFKDEPQIYPLINTIYSLYQHSDMVFRLPFSTPRSMLSFPKSIKTGLLARRKETYEDIRTKYNIDDGTPILACSFGGQPGKSIDFPSLCKAFEGVVISTNQEYQASNHICVSKETDWLDIIHGSDLLVTKPGYSTFAEATQFNKPILYSPREEYPEEKVLIDGLKSYPAKLAFCSDTRGVSAWRRLLDQIPKAEARKATFRNQNPQVAAAIMQSFWKLKGGNGNLVSVFDIGSNNLNYILQDVERNKTVHVAHYNTRLAANMNAKALSLLKSKVGSLLKMQGDAIKTNFISTALARERPQFSTFESWLESRHHAKVKVLSQNQEARLAFLAATNSLHSDKEMLVIDIGGLSTEFIWGLGKDKWQGIPYGLLSLKEGIYQEILPLVVESLPDLPDLKDKELVLVGLTGAFFAKVIYRQKQAHPWLLHGKAITKADLEELGIALENKDSSRWLPYLQRPKDEDILHISHAFLRLILDKYQASRFLVSYYGISYGFYYQKTMHKQRQKR